MMVRAVRSKLPSLDVKWAVGILLGIILSLVGIVAATLERRVATLEASSKVQAVDSATTETELKTLLKQNEKDHKAIQRGIDDLIQMHLKPSAR